MPSTLAITIAAAMSDQPAAVRLEQRGPRAQQLRVAGGTGPVAAGGRPGAPPRIVPPRPPPAPNATGPPERRVRRPEQVREPHGDRAAP